MSNYTKTTNFASKDNLSPGNPLKIVKGTEIDTEYNNIATAIATKTDNASAAITGGSITGITDLAIADGGTGASTANAALNNLLPSQTSNANKYLQTDGTNTSWDAISLSTADITGTLPVANGGTGVTTSTGTGNVVLSNSPTLVTPALGTPASGVATNLTGLPISTGVSGLGTGVATFLGTPSSANLASAVTDETGSGALVFANSPTLVTPALGTPASGVLTNATGLPISTGVSGLGTGVATFLGTPSSANLASAVSDETGSGALVFANSPTLVTPALGTPSALVGTNITGTASGLTAGNVTTNANLTGAVTSVGNASSLGSFTSSQLANALSDETGSGSAVFATSPTLVTPILGTPTSATLTNATGLPISTGVSGLGTGVATALAVNVGSSGAPLVNGGVLGTPSSGTATNLTGLPLTTGVTGTLPTANGGTNLTSFTSGGVVYASSSSALATGSALTFNGTAFGIGPQGTSGQLVVADAITTFVAANQDRRYRAALQLGSNFYGGEIYGGLNSVGSQTFNIGVYDGTSTSTVSAVFQANNTKFYASGSEALTLTSTSLYTASGINVGIGTSSPASFGRLVVKTAGTSSTQGFSVQASADESYLNIYNNGSAHNIEASYGSTGSYQPIRFNISGIEGMQLTATGLKTASTISVGAATPSTSGAGITFPATQSASSDANTLDDYEEGTWTAAFVPTTSGTITMDGSFSTGRYTKVGRLVTASLHARFTAISSPVGTLNVTGLPFASGASNQVRAAGSIIAFDTAAPANTSIVFYLSNNSTTPVIAGFSQTLLDASSYIKASSEIYFSITYITD